MWCNNDMPFGGYVDIAPIFGIKCQKKPILGK